MLKAEILIDKKSYGLLFEDLKSKLIKADIALKSLADMSVDVMRKIIKTQAKRKPTTDQLESAIDSELIEDNRDRLSYGVGNITILDDMARYWRVVNWGGWIPPATIGYFDNYKPPIAGMTGERWYYRPSEASSDPFARFIMIPKKPIPPMNYIEKTGYWIANNWRQIIDNYIKK